MSAPRISYYAHHMGSGHLRHAHKILDSGLFELQVTSTGERNENLLPAQTNYVSLPPDVSASTKVQPVTGGYLHYAPTGTHIVDRFATLNQAWQWFGPDVVMVDVSVEVALFAKLSGYRVAMRRMPGTRTDPAHVLAYDIADALFAYYPEQLEDPSHLHKYGHKTHCLAVPKPQLKDPAPNAASTALTFGFAEQPTVVVQTSLGASIGQAAIIRAARATPRWTWHVLGSVHDDGGHLPENLQLHAVVPDPEAWMAKATVVITSAGHNAVVAAAVSGRPVLLIAEERPFNEQHCFAQMLHQATGCMVEDSWDSPVDWNATLERAAASDGSLLSKALFVTQDEFASRLERLTYQLMGSEQRC
ncbi:glycosyltransferase [Arthrobacter sp. MYb213]|uniref:glycosyltransferase n=1 Tax=Arthrobacter sp. MYb213 TaxID=1848595 RepID=UPI000CFD2900|nr:glycosyltransferase [Arthrobacter sp. MYb213]